MLCLVLRLKEKKKMYFCLMKWKNFAAFEVQYYRLLGFEERLDFLQKNLLAVYDEGNKNDYIQILHLLGTLMMERGWYTEVLTIAERLHEEGDTSSQNLYLQESAKACIALYEEAQKHHLAYAFSKELACYERILSYAPEDANAYFNQGNAFFCQSEYQQALASYQNATQIYPEDHQAWFNLAFVAEKLDLYEVALEGYEKVIMLTPQNSKSYLNKAHILLQMQRIKEAIQTYKQAYSLGEEEALYVLSEIQKTYPNYFNHER